MDIRETGSPLLPRPDLEEAPPILGSWTRVYLAVMIYLVCLLGILSAISNAFHY